MKKQLSVLLVDDDEEEYFLLKEMISNPLEGTSPSELDLAWVSSIEDAVKTFSDNRYDVYLVDYRLGSCSGLDLLREAMTRECPAPIIMLTGKGNYVVDLAAMQLGAADYLVKDQLNLPLLERSIRYAIERKEVQNELERLVQERTQELAQSNFELQAEVARRRQTEAILRESEIKFRALTEATSAAIFILEDLKIIYANPAVRFVTGYQPEELLEKKFTKLIHPVYRAIFLQTGGMTQWVEGLPARYELKIIKKSGEERWVDVTSGQIELNGRQGWVVTAFDITERDLAEQGLRLAKERLEAEVAERTALLEQQAQELKNLATTDPLTGRINRRVLFELGQREVERFQRFGRPLSAIMFDIDHFKGINDTYGHSVGDEVLVAVVERCCHLVRQVDILGRYGGDEFVILLPEADLHLANGIAERIRSSVNDIPVTTAAGLVSVSISLGIAGVTQDTHNFAQLLAAADQALYSSKQAGRGMVVLYQTPSNSSTSRGHP